MADYVKILIFSVSSFAILFLISKMLGKKQVAELEFIDYVVGISIGSIAAEMATELEKDFWVYLIAMGVFFLLHFFINFLGRKAVWMKKFFKGTPIIIIDNGQLNYKAMKKANLDVNDIIGLARAKNFFNLSDIAYAIFETNGELSILPKSGQRPLVLQDLNQKEGRAKLCINLIVDGAVSTTGLDMLKKNKKWLYEKLKIKSKKDLQQILLATYDPSTDQFDIQEKK